MFSVTNNAFKQLDAQLAAAAEKYINIAIRKSGCSGYKYFIELCDDTTDKLILTESPVTIVTDKANEQYVQNVQLDYIQEGLNRSFKFSNPDAKGECGCGESFTF